MLINHCRVLLVALAATMYGCSQQSPIHATFWGTSTELSSDYFWNSWDQYGTATINGALPRSFIGGLQKRPNESMPQAEVGVSNGCSYEVITEIDTPEGGDRLNCLVEAKGKIITLQQLADDVVMLQLRIAQERNEKPVAANLVPGNADETLKLSQFNAMLANETKAATGRQEGLATLQTKLEAARKAFKCQYGTVNEALNKSGMFLIRWKDKKQGAVGAKFSKLFSAEGESVVESEGFVLARGIRIRSLIIGPDFGDAIANLAKFRNLRGLYLTTQVIEVRDRVSLNELRTSFAIKLAAEINARDFAANLDSLDKLEIQFVASRLMNLGNTAVVGFAKSRNEPIDWSKRFGGQDQDTSHPDEKWTPLFTVKAKVADVADLLWSPSSPWGGAN